MFAFQSAVLIGIAGVFQIYALLLLPLWWWGERMVRGFKFKSFVASLIGVGLVYWLVFALFVFGGVSKNLQLFLILLLGYPSRNFLNFLSSNGCFPG